MFVLNLYFFIGCFRMVHPRLKLLSAGVNSKAHSVGTTQEIRSLSAYYDDDNVYIRGNGGSDYGERIDVVTA